MYEKKGQRGMKPKRCQKEGEKGRKRERVEGKGRGGGMSLDDDIDIMAII